MLIAHLEAPATLLQGDQLYRTVQPCNALAALENTYVLSGAWLSGRMQAALRQADVVVVCQSVELDLLPLWQRRLQAQQPCVLEINDHYAALPPGSSAASFYNNPLMRQLLEYLAQQASALQWSSTALARLFGHLNACQATFMNHCALPAQPPQPAKAALRLGWAGSLGHHDDIAAIVPCVTELLQRYPQLHWAAMMPRQLHPLFAALPAARCTLHDLADMPTYMRFVASLDIGVAPLQDTPFNRCRSDVKYLEYTLGGAVAVLQDLTPYRQSATHGVQALLFQTPADLQTQLATLLTDAPRRLELVRQAQQQLAATRLESQHSTARQTFYQQLCRHRPPADDPHGARRFARLTQNSHAPAWAASQQLAPRYQPLALSRAETLLYEGLLQRAQPATALQLYARAAQLAPQAYLAPLYTGQLHPDARQALPALQQALRLCPQSFAAWHSLARRSLEVPEASGVWARSCAALRQLAASFVATADSLAWARAASTTNQ